MVKPIRFMSLTAAIGVALGGGLLSADTLARSPLTASTSVQVTSQIKGSETYIITFAEEGLLHNRGSGSVQATAPDATGQRKLDVHSAAATSYQAYLKSQRDAHLSTIKSALGRDIKATHTYDITRNGVAAHLTAAEAAQIAALPGVKSVRPAGTQEQVIYRGPKFIGADTIWNGTNTPGNVGTKGEGIVFGDLDGGTSSGNPLFANDPVCGFRASKPKLIAVDCSATDVNGYCAGPNPEANPGYGHGVHTSSTVAGDTIDNTVTPAPLFPDGVTMSGVAPCAAIHHYKVCQTNQCAGADILAGIENAIADQVDVLNFSISGGTDPWNDNDRDFLDAVNADVFVAAAAGNTQAAGEDPHSKVNHLGPWVITVAASTQDEVIGPQVALISPAPPVPPPDLGHIQLTPGSTTLVASTADFAGMPILSYPTNVTGCTATGGFPANYFYGGAVALIRRGTCSFVEKITNAAAAGASMVLVGNNQPGSITMATTGTTLPSFSMSQTDGDALLASIASNDPPAPDPDVIFADHFETYPGAAVIAYSRDVISATQGDVIASFSYRGPVEAPTTDSTKPDISAPGVNIYAGTDPASGNYQFMSGTSMATPHVTGSAALMRAVHPNWTVPEVKSALMMTATNTNGVLEDGVTPWTIDDVGSGRVDLTKAALAGLTLDETYANFLAADPAASGDVKTLNLPLLRNGLCAPNCTWTRTFKNQLTTSGSWTITSSHDSTFGVTATPSSFTLAAGATQTVTFKATPNTLLTNFAFGTFILTEGSALSPPEHVTIAVRSTDAPPPTVTCSGGSCVLKADLLTGSFAGLGCASYCGFTWLNRYTPDPADYPITLDTVTTIFGSGAGWNASGDQVSVYVYQDDDTDPTNGATAVGNPTVYTMGTPANAFVDITLDTPLVLNGPGEIIIALSNPNTANVGARPAALDAGPFLGRAYIGDVAPSATANPDLSTLNLALMSDACCTRNNIIRASGTNSSGAPIVLGGWPGPVTH
jgi:subtilisin family serine protease